MSSLLWKGDGSVYYTIFYSGRSSLQSVRNICSNETFPSFVRVRNTFCFGEQVQSEFWSHNSKLVVDSWNSVPNKSFAYPEMASTPEPFNPIKEAFATVVLRSRSYSGGQSQSGLIIWDFEMFLLKNIYPLWQGKVIKYKHDLRGEFT